MFWSVPMCQKCLQTNMWMFFLDESNFMFGLFICQNEESPRRAAFSLRCRQKLFNAKGFRASLRRPARKGAQETNRYALETSFCSLNVFARVYARAILNPLRLANTHNLEDSDKRWKFFRLFPLEFRKFSSDKENHRQTWCSQAEQCEKSTVRVGFHLFLICRGTRFINSWWVSSLEAHIRARKNLYFYDSARNENIYKENIGKLERERVKISNPMLILMSDETGIFIVQLLIPLLSWRRLSRAFRAIPFFPFEMWHK